MIVHFTGHIQKVESKADRSIKLTLITSTEINNPTELAKIFSMTDEVVGVGIKEGSFKQEELLELPEPDPEYKGDKSPAQRMRGIIYRIWEQKGKRGEFMDYYKSKMESLNDRLKDQLT